MLAIPLIPPQGTPTLHQRFRPRAESPPPPPVTAAAQVTALHRQQQQRRDEERKAHNARSPLAQLVADEISIAQRKAAIRDFGAYWIRPPGIGKTLQAMREEEQERLEQEEFARQEMGWRDMQAVQEQEEARQRAATTADQDANEEAEPERDLDADIPDADATNGEVSFNDDSLMEGSHLVERSDLDIADRIDATIHENNDEDELAREEADMVEAELTGAARDEEELGMDDEERDLDDSIPEAGSYQHTDTEEEDTSESDSELQDSFAMRSAQRSARVLRSGSSRQTAHQTLPISSPRRQPIQLSFTGGLQERMRAQVNAADLLPRSPGSINLGSSLLESSFVHSSPILQRGQQAARTTRAAETNRRPGRRS